MCDILHQSYRPETSNSFQTKALDTGCRDIGASSFPAGFYFCFDLIFLYYVPFIPSEFSKFMLEVCNLIFGFIGVIVKRLP